MRREEVLSWLQRSRGGTVFPAMAGAVATHTSNFHHAMVIPATGYILAFAFPLYINLYKGEYMDVHRNTDLNDDETKTAKPKEGQLENASVDAGGIGKGAIETVERA